MNTKQIEKSAKNLNFRFPIIGHLIRMNAVKKLAAIGTIEVIPHLIGALKGQDFELQEFSNHALRNLKNQEAIDFLCKTWFETREENLDRIISEKKYIAQKPVEVRTATALKAGKTELCDNADSVGSVVKCLSEKDLALKKNAEKTLRNLKNQEAIDALCNGITDGSYEPARAIVMECGYKPKEIGRRCLFYVITGQTEEYFDLDFEFEHLRAEYMAAPEPVQQRIRTAIQQSGDHRLMGMFGEVRRRFVAKDLTGHEAELMLDVYARNRQWEEIFALLFFAPLTVVFKALSEMKKHGWHPLDEDRKDLFDNLLKVINAMGEKPELPPEPDAVLGSVFEKWIAEGKHKTWTGKNEAVLRDAFKNGIPADAIRALSAMNEKNLLNNDDRQFAAKHPHWMLRLVYFSLQKHDIEFIFSIESIFPEDNAHWIKELTPAMIARNFTLLKAIKLNPSHVHELSEAISKQKAENTGNMFRWANLIFLLSAFYHKNAIIVGKYEEKLIMTDISL